jgi:hypothetical protein
MRAIIATILFSIAVFACVRSDAPPPSPPKPTDPVVVTPPDPFPPPAPDASVPEAPDAGDVCTRYCAAMRDTAVKPDAPCEDALDSPAGASCEERCAFKVADDLVPFHFKCREAASSCRLAELCDR